MKVFGRVLAALTFLVVLGCNTGLTAPDEEALGVLFIGNSLTVWNEMPDVVADLLDESGIDAHVETVAFPNYGLPDHWLEGSSREAIALGGWDVVVLQQGPSATEGRPYLLDYSELFAEKIREVGARPALYMVWPSSARSFDFEGVSDSYRTAAELVDGLLFPAGEAWLEAWKLDEELALYGPDGFHPSRAGSYLAALVIFQQLAGVDPRDLPTDAGNPGVPASVVTLLQEAAASANEAFARP